MTKPRLLPVATPALAMDQLLAVTPRSPVRVTAALFTRAWLVTRKSASAMLAVTPILLTVTPLWFVPSAPTVAMAPAVPALFTVEVTVRDAAVSVTSSTMVFTTVRFSAAVRLATTFTLVTVNTGVLTSAWATEVPSAVTVTALAVTLPAPMRPVRTRVVLAAMAVFSPMLAALTTPPAAGVTLLRAREV